jgi:two-component system CheB/CheR fusion protein
MTAPDNFPIVGVGASAGGVEALEGFFRGLTDNPGLSCVIVAHDTPDRQTNLPDTI